jgi:hypothetical protein
MTIAERIVSYFDTRARIKQLRKTLESETVAISQDAKVPTDFEAVRMVYEVNTKGVVDLSNIIEELIQDNPELYRVHFKGINTRQNTTT